MATYKIFNFLMSADIFTDPNYPVEEYQEYLGHFHLIPFSFDGIIKSLHFELTIQSNSRICNGYAYDKTYDQIVSSGNERFPRPVAFLTLTLWRNGNPEIEIKKNTLP
jgi:hypothetical protein